MTGEGEHEREAGEHAGKEAYRGSTSTPEKVRPRIEEVLARSRVPGCSIAVVDRSGLRWSDGYGFADLRNARPASADTVYHLFSGTKLFTAVAVLQLVEGGRLELDETVVTGVRSPRPS